MGFALTTEQFDAFLAGLARDYDIYAPKRLAGKGAFSGTDLIAYGQVQSLAEIVFDRKTFYSPKEILLPINQTLFYFTEEVYREPQQQQRPAIIFLRPCDVHAVKRLDQIYLHNGDQADPYYRERRERVKFFVIECTEGFDNCFCVSMGTNRTGEYAVFLRLEGDWILCDVRPEFAPLLAAHGREVPFTPAFIEQNKINVKTPEKIAPAVYGHPMWREYDSRCIACGRCNVCCPTCTCFSMQDIFYEDNPRCGERRRVWAGCMIDGFTDLAGGHSFRNKYGERMRFKALHKVYDFKKRFGYHMCVGCGRCDDACPEYISFSRMINRLTEVSADE